MDNGESSYRRFIEGDQSAFDELMDAYRDRLIFFIKGYVRSAEEAQDIAMDTFVEILVHPGRFRFKSSFKGLHIFRRAAQGDEFLRKKRTVPDEGEEIWDESAIDSFYRGEDAKTVRECMDRLNNDYRTVLYLVYFEEVDDGAAGNIGKSKKQLANLTEGRNERPKPELEKEGFCYKKTDKEFKNKVYARFKERAQNKKTQPRDIDRRAVLCYCTDRRHRSGLSFNIVLYERRHARRAADKCQGMFRPRASPRDISPRR